MPLVCHFWWEGDARQVQFAWAASPFSWGWKENLGFAPSTLGRGRDVQEASQAPRRAFLPVSFFPSQRKCSRPPPPPRGTQVGNVIGQSPPHPPLAPSARLAVVLSRRWGVLLISRVLAFGLCP